jgi:hypothetical protein
MCGAQTPHGQSLDSLAACTEAIRHEGVDAEQRVAHSYHELVSHLVPRSLDFLDACSQTAWV